MSTSWNGWPSARRSRAFHLDWSGKGALPRRLRRSNPCGGWQGRRRLWFASPGAADGVGRAEIVEPLGATTILHVRIDGGPDRAMRVIVTADRAPVVDERVAFRIQRDRLYLFDERTSASLAGGPSRPV
jgi:hypothetical protein